MATTTTSNSTTPPTHPTPPTPVEFVGTIVGVVEDPSLTEPTVSRADRTPWADLAVLKALGEGRFDDLTIHNYPGIDEIVNTLARAVIHATTTIPSTSEEDPHEPDPQ